MRWPCRSCKCFVLWTVVHNPASMRGLLAKASRRAVLKSVLVVPVGDMLHAQATAAVVATTTGSPRTVAMQPAANVARCEKVTFALLGDIMLGRYVDDQFEFAQRKTGAFGDVLPVLKRLDPKCSIVVGNLECAGRWQDPLLVCSQRPRHQYVATDLRNHYIGHNCSSTTSMGCPSVCSR